MVFEEESLRVPSVLGIWCRGVAWKTGGWEGCVEGGDGGGGRGALRKRAWPVGAGVGVGPGPLNHGRRGIKREGSG
ncbi:hypothetical protein VIGAN_01350900 [Vigna angularis var. angularis]|uniref:Uncharacterized protein n=1 Tax=Vigna angularis var. angularis TaxID=157739 RepID=A0A0S3R4N2_PHAAN|nr:hypothetical protein VIGAN_01350900 [Vigna angularis var. angularis]